MPLNEELRSVILEQISPHFRDFANLMPLVAERLSEMGVER
jgi:hypothetical protein